MTEERIAEAFYLASQVLYNKAQEEGYKHLGEYPGIIKATLGSWDIRLHTHDEKIEGDDPFTIYVEYNGWPAGVVDAGGGVIAAGAAANEDAFIAACREALRR